MICPHCLVAFRDELETWSLESDTTGIWKLTRLLCPTCEKFIFFLQRYYGNELRRNMLVYPKGVARAPLSPDVPEKYAEDYTEACLVLTDSPKASAALGRRCLQAILRDVAGVKQGSLSAEIDEVLASKSLPTHLAAAIDAVRNVGNFAAHPIKSNSTGEIVPVEDQEAEWILDVLEELFDFYFVQPAVLQRKKDKLNEKLTDAGKPPMK